jgi:hypothetical protein
MIRQGATENECADLLIRILCGTSVCTATAMQNGYVRASIMDRCHTK